MHQTAKHRVTLRKLWITPRGIKRKEIILEISSWVSFFIIMVTYAQKELDEEIDKGEFQG